jgi:hypothetical protein
MSKMLKFSFLLFTPSFKAVDDTECRKMVLKSVHSSYNNTVVFQKCFIDLRGVSVLFSFEFESGRNVYTCT